MTDVILSSFISLFALFGKNEHVDEVRAKEMLVSYLRRQYGIRNTDNYLDLYSDMRMAYEMTEDLDIIGTVTSICSNLTSDIRNIEKAMLLLRLMEFCYDDKKLDDVIFRKTAKLFNIPDKMYDEFINYLSDTPSEFVKIHRVNGLTGELKTLYDQTSGFLIFTYTGNETVMLNDIPVLSGSYQVWLQSSVLKGEKGRPIYYSSIIRAYGFVEDEQNVVEFCGRDINFRFPNSDNGMHNLSFSLHSGDLLAIMGGSGTGKTTLLLLLNGSIKPQEGTITINGHRIDEPQAKSLIGFVPQDDLLIEELTVYQNLWYTAKFCFDGMSDEELDKRVIKTLKALDLDSTKNLKVGSAINKYISGGQRKRLNIALELIREPAVLFLDEPTSGLSSTDTEKVINLLKEQTLKGKLIVVNIHQPSSNVYKLFDRLWLLDKGGYPVFDGNPIDAITYFKRAANYADAETSACPVCGNVNPEIILNIIDEKLLNNVGETSDERKVKPQEWHELYLKNRKEMKEPAVSSVPPSDQHKPNKLKQLGIFLNRHIHSKSTNVQYICLTLLEAPLLALICSFLTRYAPPEGYTIMDNKNLVSYFFMAVIVATFIGMSQSAEEIIKDRALLKRERFLNLSHSSYIWSKILYLAGVSLIQTLLFILVGNSIMGISGLFGTWWIILFVTALLSNVTGLLLSQCLSSIVAIYISIPLLLIPQILLCGLVVSFSDLTPKSTTGNVPAIGNIIPSRWAYEALAVTSFTDNKYEEPYFEADKKKYEYEYYNVGFLNELESQLETLKDEQTKGKPVDPNHMEVIKTNLPLITELCNMEPYSGDDSYESLSAYMDKAETILAKRSNEATLKVDAMKSAFIRENGKEALLQLKRENYNIKLEDCVIGMNERHMLDVIGKHIVPRTAMIYLTPQSRCGQAPFYSSEKILGDWHIKTIWFNLSIMLMMGIIVAIMLFLDWPGKKLRKEIT